ncbi:Large cysteine-rich periplasmic protein omcB [Candidatus Thermoflexus japonica]|uniref:Large cysteine-rich periplasmic protein omcB n=1 Tax=Candidatus Thermoflexus japonica TaxID=2035417 RepID=A0A2H5Y9U1_9CHLR|nr:Large cysteine-rich periplasmic protein omcB [Candidatus Thermoflexus japonica]
MIAGNPITYTAILTNNGPSDAQTVGVNFTFPSGLTLLGLSPSQGACSGAACNLGLLPAGTAARITVTARVNASAPEGSLTVQAQAASSTTDPNVANNTASATTQVRTQADLALTMNDTPDPVFAGDPLTYTLTVTSSGPSDARDVRIDLTLADGLTPLRLSASQGTCEDRSCSLGTLPPGSIARITTTVRVNSNVTNGSYLTTLATVSSITTDPNSTNNTATATTRVQTQADLSLSLSDDPDPVIAGNPITYTAILTNNGPSDAQTVGVNFTFPSGLTLLGLSPSQGACSGAACNLGLLPAGAAARITVTARVNASAPEGTLTTQAQAASSTTDPNVANNAASATTQVQTQADLSLSLSDDPDPVIAGRALVYRLTAINQGPSDARNVQLTLTLPTEVSLLSFVPDICTATSSTIRCDRDRLTAGDMFTMVVTVTVRADLNQGYVLIARAEGISLTTDPAPDNNTAIASTEVVLEADLQAALTGEPAEVFVGDVITYTLTVTNAGPSKASGVIVTLNLPPGLNVEDVLASSGSCSIGTPRCELGELAVGAIATVRWRVRVAQWPGTPISVQGEVSTDAVDPNPADNRPEIQTAVRFRVFLPLIFR